jgi:hypothetical protein
MARSRTTGLNITGGGRIEGFGDLYANLGILKKGVEKRVIYAEMKEAMMPIRDAAEAAAPARDASDPDVTFGKGDNKRKRPRGTMRRLFLVGTRLTRGQQKLQRVIGKSYAQMFVGTRDPIARQQEFGNRHHAAQPMLRPAWDRHGGTILLTRFVAQLREKLLGRIFKQMKIKAPR